MMHNTQAFNKAGHMTYTFHIRNEIYTNEKKGKTCIQGTQMKERT